MNQLCLLYQEQSCGCDLKDKAHIKTLGKWFNDVYNKRKLYINSKRLSLYVYKNKTNKNTADKCIKIYYVS